MSDNQVVTSRLEASLHTPGPWSVSDRVCRLRDDRYLVILSRERWVCLVMEGPKGEEDARLISAAPALLGALTELYHKTICGTDDERHAALNAAWGTIAKATGGTP